MQIDKTLKEAIINNNLVVFAGAGVTMYLDMPNWKDLAIEAIRYLSENEENMCLINELQAGVEPIRIFDRLEKSYKSEIKRYISQKFRISNSNTFQLHKRILRLTSQIVTTNYDDAFELAYIQMYNETIPNISIQNRDRQNLADLLKSQEFIFKIHGCATQPESCAVFSSDYKSIYRSDSPAFSQLKSLITQKVFLFIGFSFNDQTIKKIFNQHTKMFNDCIKHFILTPSPKNFEDCKYLSPIEVSFGDIDDFLSKLSVYKKPIIEEKTDSVLVKLKEKLSTSVLFDGVTNDGIDMIAKTSSIYVLSKGEYLCRMGDTVNSFWLILDGCIAAIKNNEKTTVRTTGSVIGELGLLEKRKQRSSDLIADKHKTKVVEIGLDLVYELSTGNQMNIWKNLASMLGSKIERLDLFICQLQQTIKQCRNDDTQNTTIASVEHFGKEI